MKEAILNTFSGIGVWVLAWATWAWLMNLHKFTRSWSFHFTILLIAILTWAFVWYIVQEYTESGALAWVAGAVSMRIFDLLDNYSWAIIKQLIEKKLWIKLENKQKQCKK